MSVSSNISVEGLFKDYGENMQKNPLGNGLSHTFPPPEIFPSPEITVHSFPINSLPDPQICESMIRNFNRGLFQESKADANHILANSSLYERDVIKKAKEIRELCNSYENTMDEANELMSKGNYCEARVLLRPILALFPYQSFARQIDAICSQNEPKNFKIFRWNLKKGR